VICDFPINFNIKPIKVLSLLFNKTNHKTPSGLLTELIKSKQDTAHTCTLAEAMKINISNITFLFTINKINAYKNK
jgi:hypothetical protein